MTHSIDDGRPARKRRAILIAGPTASGKSRLALGLAERLGGVVINADSMQVYRELRILTAPADARGGSAGAARALRLRQRRGGLFGRALCGRRGAGHRRGTRRRAACPIIVGGTGLYFKVLLEGLSPVPPIDPGVRARWRAAGSSEVRRRSCTPAGRARPADGRAPDADRSRSASCARSRCSRARAARWPTGRREPGTAGAGARRRRCGCWCCPTARRTRQSIDARFDAMLAAARSRRCVGCLRSASRRSCRSCGRSGVAPLASPPRGRGRAGGGGGSAKAETRQYAKRQLTWLKTQYDFVEEPLIRNIWKDLTLDILPFIDP